jgi:cytochrome c-type biogenesis protein CcmE
VSPTDADVDDPGAGTGVDDAADTDLDLTPRTTGGRGPARSPARRRANPLLWVVLVGVVAGIGLVVWNGLRGATLYFRNVDEAVAQRDELGTRRFRLQGLVVDDPVTEGDTVSFEVTFNDVVVPVRSTEGLPALFEPGRPVVMEGRFADGEVPLFLADEVFVKHDEVYEADNGERLDDAGDGRSGDQQDGRSG